LFWWRAEIVGADFVHEPPEYSHLRGIEAGGQKRADAAAEKEDSQNSPSIHGSLIALDSGCGTTCYALLQNPDTLARHNEIRSIGPVSLV